MSIKHFYRKCLKMMPSPLQRFLNGAYQGLKKQRIQQPSGDQSHLEQNRRALEQLGLSPLSATRKLKELGLEFDDPKLSWHYHIFAALAERSFDFGACPRILEIGTFDGRFTRYLSVLFPHGQIITLDLPDSSREFRLSYNRRKKSNFESFLKRRTGNLDQPNITFIQVSSSEIPKIFEGQVFDFIWIDGDHLDPQVSADIRNSLSLMTAGSYMLNDDVITEPTSAKNISEAAHETLQELQRDGRLENVFFLKRTTPGQDLLKFVVVSRKLSGDLAARA